MQGAFFHFSPADRLSRRSLRERVVKGSCGHCPSGGPGRGFFGRFGSSAVVFGLILGLFAGFSPAPAAAQAAAAPSSPVRVRPSPQLFATLCALYAAGYPNLPSDIPPQLRQLVLNLTTSQDSSVVALREFYKKNQASTPAATLAEFVSFAMVVGPPPTFDYIVPEEGLPPDVRDMEGLQRLLREYYAQENIDRLWQEVRPHYELEADELRGPVSTVVSVAMAYTRRMNRFEGGRSFTVNVDPLIGAVPNFRIYSERYEVAVNPAEPGTLEHIRHAFLHFLLDPLPFDARADVDSLRFLQNFAVRAPRLSEYYKYDWVAFVDECFVRSVELHLEGLSGASLADQLDRDDRDGFVLVRPLYYGLDTYARSQMTLVQYFPRLIKSINVKTEAARERQILFAPARKGVATPAEAAIDQSERWVDLGDQQIASQNAKGAIASFQHVLKLDPNNVRALYGLAVASAMDGQGERAHQLFTEIVQPPASTQADPSVLAWSHVYLGRMNDLMGRRDHAVIQYKAALNVAGLPPAARDAAQQGLKKPYAPKGQNPNATPQR
jgi:tetratricopeptide (TPR) repeat protein